MFLCGSFRSITFISHQIFSIDLDLDYLMTNLTPQFSANFWFFRLCAMALCPAKK